MKFRVGDRVRIACPSDVNGKQGIVWRIKYPPMTNWSDYARQNGCRWWHAAYLVNIDGMGPITQLGSGFFGFAHFQLRPATDPKAAAFIESMRRFAIDVAGRGDALHNERGGAA